MKTFNNKKNEFLTNIKNKTEDDDKKKNKKSDF